MRQAKLDEIQIPQSNLSQCYNSVARNNIEHKSFVTLTFLTTSRRSLYFNMSHLVGNVREMCSKVTIQNGYSSLLLYNAYDYFRYLIRLMHICAWVSVFPNFWHLENQSWWRLCSLLSKHLSSRLLDLIAYEVYLYFSFSHVLEFSTKFIQLDIILPILSSGSSRIKPCILNLIKATVRPSFFVFHRAFS